MRAAAISRAPCRRGVLGDRIRSEDDSVVMLDQRLLRRASRTCVVRSLTRSQTRSARWSCVCSGNRHRSRLRDGAARGAGDRRRAMFLVANAWLARALAGATDGSEPRLAVARMARRAASSAQLAPRSDVPRCSRRPSRSIARTSPRAARWRVRRRRCAGGRHDPHALQRRCARDSGYGSALGVIRAAHSRASACASSPTRRVRICRARD